MKKLTLISLLLLTGCAAFQNDVTMFRTEALKCPGHVTLHVTQDAGHQTLRFECEWGKATEQQPEDVPYEEVI